MRLKHTVTVSPIACSIVITSTHSLVTVYSHLTWQCHVKYLHVVLSSVGHLQQALLTRHHNHTKVAQTCNLVYREVEVMLRYSDYL